jgi:hypothetical protein
MSNDKDNVGQFAAYAADETGFYLDRRLSSVWNSYGDERAWHRAASEYEAQLATFSPVVVSHGGKVFRPLRTVASMAALLTVGLGAMSASASASPDVQSVEAQARRLPAAANAQAAEANQRQLAPSVKAAVVAGHGRELLESTSSPDVRVDLLRYGTSTTTHSPDATVAKPSFAGAATAARHRARAHAAGCYGSPWTQEGFTEFGVTVAWIFVRENGWCGAWGSWIYWLGGPTFATWAGLGFCGPTGHGENYSWDGSTQWVHMANWGGFGVSYPWGCASFHGMKVVQRIAWNGYWDRYNDYGF